MGAGPLIVTYPLTGRSRAIVEEELGGTAGAIYLVDLAPAARADALRRAGAVLSHDTSKELRPDEILLIRNTRLLQFTAAGVDWVPTRDLPRELPVAANKGGGAEPMAEHIVALALGAAKRLFIEHANLKSGEFNQRSANRMLRGGVCGILGFGNVGVATARLMRVFDAGARAAVFTSRPKTKTILTTGVNFGGGVRQRVPRAGSRDFRMNPDPGDP
jgi:phosphoglycerate dehydrogenase-like enzyme